MYPCNVLRQRLMVSHEYGEWQRSWHTLIYFWVAPHFNEAMACLAPSARSRNMYLFVFYIFELRWTVVATTGWDCDMMMDVWNYKIAKGFVFEYWDLKASRNEMFQTKPSCHYALSIALCCGPFCNSMGSSERCSIPWMKLIYTYSKSQLARMCGACNRMERATGLPTYGDWQRFMGGITMDPLAQDDLRFLCAFSACVFLNLLTLCLVILRRCFHFFLFNV